MVHRIVDHAGLMDLSVFGASCKVGRRSAGAFRLIPELCREAGLPRLGAAARGGITIQGRHGA